MVEDGADLLGRLTSDIVRCLQGRVCFVALVKNVWTLSERENIYPVNSVGVEWSGREDMKVAERPLH